MNSAGRKRSSDAAVGRLALGSVNCAANGGIQPETLSSLPAGVLSLLSGDLGITKEEAFEILPYTHSNTSPQSPTASLSLSIPD
ncbi:hypothetical protein AFLA_005597 [Aspergillus flavus NRRL3357]|nr:hypothetical protein AFLA_005597 [Aspergillus flavus NRRL3357]